MKRRRIIIGLIILTFAWVFTQGFRHSTEHVDKMMAGEPHSLNCLSCHAYTQRGGLLTKVLENQTYLSPFTLDIDQATGNLLVLAQDAQQLISVNPDSKKINKRIPLGNRPHTVKSHPSNGLTYISNQWSDNLWVIDLNSSAILDTIDVGGGPGGFEFSSDASKLYVANTYTDNLSVIDLQTNSEIRRLETGNEPIGVAVSPKNDIISISSRRTLPVEFRTEPRTEVTLVNSSSNRVKNRVEVRSGHIMENIAYTPDGRFVLTSMIMPKNLVPSVQIEQGWMMNHGIGVIEVATGRQTRLILDEPNAFFADPFDVKIDPTSNLAYVSHSGADAISVVDLDLIYEIFDNASEDELVNAIPNNIGLSRELVIKRIPVGANPKGMVIDHVRGKLYVAERLDDAIAVINIRTNEVEDHIELKATSAISTVRLGAQMFNNAGHTFHQQYSCYTCHPDGHEDGLTYDMSSKGGNRNLANVQTLRDLAGTGPYKWNGTNTSIYMQCGMRFSKFITRSEVFDEKQLDGLVAYIIQDLKHPPNLYHKPNEPLTPAQARGKIIYERTTTNKGEIIPEGNRCTTCHPAPNYSNFQLADVGTLKEYDDETLFDSPNLNNVYESAPYLHDGSAATLEEIWTVYNDYDEHGVANDLTKNQLNDLIEYLKSLGSAESYTLNID